MPPSIKLGISDEHDKKAKNDKFNQKSAFWTDIEKDAPCIISFLAS